MSAEYCRWDNSNGTPLGSFIEEEEEGGSEHTSEHTRTTRGGRRQCQQSLDPYKLPLRPPPNTNTTEYDSLDYDVCYNVPYKKQLKSYTKFTYWHINVMRWVLVAIIGILTGAVGVSILIAMEYLTELKYSQLKKVYEYLLPSGTVAIGLFVLLGFNVLYALISAIVPIYEPLAGGSGVPELMCYLNGVKIPGVIQIRAVVGKAFGLIFSTASGFFVGQEGPMFYIGAVIGSGVSQLQSFLPFMKRFPIPYPYFRSDREKRDFVSSGAAAGVAAAFGAPIGGTLFALEEGSSFWNQGLTWRTLFCSFCATFTFKFMRSLYFDIPGELGNPGLVNFGTYMYNNTHLTLWKAQHLVIFVVMGAIGGLLGALFNSLNTRVVAYRMKFLMKRKYPRYWRALEAMLIIVATTYVVYFCAMFLGTCVPFALDKGSGVTITDEELNRTESYFCPETEERTRYHNDFSTLTFNGGVLTITQIFHLTDAYSATTLGIGLLFIFLLTCWTLGAAVPSGLFVPSILIGAVYGRFFAALFQQYPLGWISSFILDIYPGTYALIGAAAFMGGVMRMTISLTVILIETTEQVSYGLPIVITLMVAKWVGDLFNHGIYHTGIHLKRIPYLDEKVPDQLDSLLAEDIMSEGICFLYPITRVGSLYQLLRTTKHSAFPVVTPLTSDAKPIKNVSNQHVPSLYGENFSLAEGGSNDHGMNEETNNGGGSNVNVSSKRRRNTFRTIKVRSYNRRTIRKPQGQGAPVFSAQLNDGDGLEFAYSIPPSPAMAEELQTQNMSYKIPLVLHGMILRTQLIQLLKRKIFFDESSQPELQTELTHEELMEGYPRFGSLESIGELSHSEENKLMDVTLYMNPCPYTISNQAPLPQVFTLFRTMGLRHLPVVKASGVLVGIITRHDLAHHRLEAFLEESLTTSTKIN